ncbi:LytR/AlgR family response regulator transcription factor [Hymenobacter convexus]|uniref:LytR/AlgR family response regulator transcription factor n=1 Tax=Hymenobacter sp. CA1UV-4 TaxID=3063782 RepID=UPI00271324C5|nr:LytTR family DNA-binding domain-containing protein [Hymenobacter sp. CA1UV-4]MDO7852506.1 LytTR family DNA-binding domain-containing protein [Hymenobacter sp. CA1UV-4]
MAESAPLRCLIVDDNEASRLMLAHLVGLTESLALVASLPDGVQALHFLQTQPPVDILLLDIEMPELTGLALIPLLPTPQPEIILVTTHRGFALEAFELHVTDYLVKPLDYARFRQAIDVAVRRRRAALTQAAAAALPVAAQNGTLDNWSELFVKVNNRLVKLNFDDVLYIEAMSMYSVLVMANHKYIVHATLKQLAERLPFAHFQRVHRSYIVNTRLIDSIEDNTLVVGPYEVPLAKSYQETLFNSIRSL